MAALTVTVGSASSSATRVESIGSSAMRPSESKCSAQP